MKLYLRYRINKIYLKIFNKLKFIYLKIRVWNLSNYIVKKGNKYLFIDCGANIGQGFNFFKNYFDPKVFDYILIEPNPNCIEHLKKLTNDKVMLIEKGVWSSEKNLKLYGISKKEDKYFLGASLIKDYKDNKLVENEENLPHIQTICLSNLIKDKKKEYDTIIVKMDIESSEYEVLPQLLKDNTIDLIDHIFVEFHSKYYNQEKKIKFKILEKKLIEEIKIRKVGFTNWI